tara:strand:+ start:351 stop:587 length:237 start_codon:yes stop_codon:yes gene_type:complete
MQGEDKRNDKGRKTPPDETLAADPEVSDAMTDAAEKSNENKSREPEEYPDPEFESGGPKGPEPTRYGDWERKGIISDF